MGEGHQGRIASAAGDVIVVEAFTGRANDVDYYALVARLHVGVNEAGEIDIAEYFQLPGMTPRRLVNLIKGATGNVTGIVDKYIDARGFARQPMQIV